MERGQMTWIHGRMSMHTDDQDAQEHHRHGLVAMVGQTNTDSQHLHHDHDELVGLQDGQ